MRRVLHQHRRAQLGEEGLAQAEAAYKKAIEVDPNSADAYNGLANVYNARRSSTGGGGERPGDEAAAPRRRGGGGSASTRVQPGVILWNAGKIPEAQEGSSGGGQADQARRSALLARHGESEPRQDARGRHRSSRSTSRSRHRPVRRAGQGHLHADQEVTGAHQWSGRAPDHCTGDLAARRGPHRRQPRASGPDRRGGAPRRPGPGGRHPHRRLEDVRRRARPGRLAAGQREFGENKVQEALQKIGGHGRHSGDGGT